MHVLCDCEIINHLTVKLFKLCLADAIHNFNYK